MSETCHDELSSISAVSSYLVCTLWYTNFYGCFKNSRIFFLFNAQTRKTIINGIVSVTCFCESIKQFVPSHQCRIYAPHRGKPLVLEVVKTQSLLKSKLFRGSSKLFIDSGTVWYEQCLVGFSSSSRNTSELSLQV